jgi:hypothetical protein
MVVTPGGTVQLPELVNVLMSAHAPGTSESNSVAKAKIVDSRWLMVESQERWVFINQLCSEQGAGSWGLGKLGNWENRKQKAVGQMLRAETWDRTFGGRRTLGKSRKQKFGKQKADRVKRIRATRLASGLCVLCVLCGE